VWNFRSRPDLSPPAVEVTKQAHDDTASGYVFVAPEEGGTAQGGSMIFDDRGQVVWFRPLRHPILPSSRAMNSEVQTYRGRPVLTWMETPGEYVREFVICDLRPQNAARKQILPGVPLSVAGTSLRPARLCGRAHLGGGGKALRKLERGDGGRELGGSRWPKSGETKVFGLSTPRGL
jgi:hypothetical protein